MKNITLINPSLVVQRNDRFTTGVVYMPIGLASIAACILESPNYVCTVIDGFGEAPTKAEIRGEFAWYGLNSEQIIARIPVNVSIIFAYANQLINHASLCEIIKKIKDSFPEIKVVILENTQAVTAYALRPVSSELYAAGADYILSGEGERRTIKCVQAIESNNPEELKAIDGLSWNGYDHPPELFIENLDQLPFPAWELFPIKNYWKLGFAHGPQTQKKYLPVLTSRGCPYPCNFCVVPETNEKKWRYRSPKSVVDEFEYLIHKFGVTEFHWEDLNPTIQDERIREICREVILRRLPITWKIVAGTKAETIKSVETIRLMSLSGCRYISISPESGSKRILKLIDKPFKTEHAISLIREMNKQNIKSQACFVLGFPGESDADRMLTSELVESLIKNGLDEIAIFIISPVPGSIIFGDFKGYTSLSQLNFTPKWREDYEKLNKFRMVLYIKFLLWKSYYFPLKIIRQVFNFISRKFETKMEMVPYKATTYYLLEIKSVIIKIFKKY